MGLTILALGSLLVAYYYVLGSSHYADENLDQALTASAVSLICFCLLVITGLVTKCRERWLWISVCGWIVGALILFVGRL